MVPGLIARAIDDWAKSTITQSGRARARRDAAAEPSRRVWLPSTDSAYPDLEAPFFCDPSCPRIAKEPVRSPFLPSLAYDLTWPSDLELFCADRALRDRYASIANNRTARARVFAPNGLGRRTAVIIHGYLGGAYWLEERVWPVRRLLREGWNVALFVMPFHGLRRPDNGKHLFPSSDPRFTNEALRQAVFDIQGLVRALFEEGAPEIGLMGMSLGGYVASLTATIEEKLSFLLPIIPLASLADLAQEQGTLGTEGPNVAVEYELLCRALRIASPLSRPSRIAPHRVVIGAGQSDRITPIRHAEKLHRHFGGELITFEGGHLFQWGRSRVFDAFFKQRSELRR